MTRTLTINMIMIFTKAIKDTLSPFEMSLKFQIFLEIYDILSNCSLTKKKEYNYVGTSEHSFLNFGSNLETI